MSTTAKLTKKDFQTDQEVRWCPGCGDYAILNAVQQAFPDIGIPRHEIVMVSGIGCAARFPYYMNTYGFHTVHGRAPAVATGVKIANPDLSVWVVSGDGDALSIGGNHLIHTMRRNVDLNILLFNNRIYGLTKGQFSPTSETGKRTKSSPMGTVDRPFNPLRVALGAEATFVARGVDVQGPLLQSIVTRAAQHRGTGFVEILQNCNIFNNRAWAHLVDKSVRAEEQVLVEHGKPLVFGAERDKGIRLSGPHLEVIDLAEHDESEVLVHDETDRSLAWLLGQLGPPDFPTPVGVLLAVEEPTFDASLVAQDRALLESEGPGDLEALLASGNTWTVEPGDERAEETGTGD